MLFYGFKYRLNSYIYFTVVILKKRCLEKKMEILLGQWLDLFIVKNHSKHRKSIQMIATERHLIENVYF